MPESPAERLRSLNRQAIAILRLDVPLDLGLGSDPQAALGKINDQLMLDVGNDVSVDSLLQKHQFPEHYQAIARMLLATDDPAPVFQAIASQQLDHDLAKNPFRQALAEPLVVAGLGYLGLILLCFNTVPHLEAQYIQQNQQPTGATQLLIQVRNAMPYWIIGFPVLVLTVWFFGRKFFGEVVLRFFPGVKSYSRWLAAESQTRRLAALVGSNVDGETAISLARRSTTPEVPVRPIAESIVRDGDPPSQPRALQRLAGFYQFLADDRRRSSFYKTPALIGLLLAGFIVLAYGLATFLPWIEILANLSEREGA
jgi:type II secretory pathway component PulF